jgi:hypothetical protein
VKFSPEVTMETLTLKRKRRKTLPSDIDWGRVAIVGLLVLIPIVGLIVYFARRP